MTTLAEFEASLQPGKVHYLTGLHDAGINDRSLTISVPDVTIIADVVIISAGVTYRGKLTDNGFVADAYNTYRLDNYSGSTGSQMRQQDIRLIPQSGAPDGSWPAGSFSQVGQTLYVRPVNDWDEGPYYTNNGTCVSVNADNVKLLGRWRVESAKNAFVFNGNNIVADGDFFVKWAGSNAYQMDGSSVGGLSGCHFRGHKTYQCGLGWYIHTQIDDCVWEDLEFIDTNTDKFYNAAQTGVGIEPADQHAIGVQFRNNNVIENVLIDGAIDIAFSVYQFGSQPMEYNTIRNVTIKNVRDTVDQGTVNEMRGRAFQWGGDNTITAGKRGNVISDLVVRGVKEGCRIKGREAVEKLRFDRAVIREADTGVLFTSEDIYEGDFALVNCSVDMDSFPPTGVTATFTSFTV